MTTKSDTRTILVGDCGCGAPAVYRIRMTDRLWNEVFSVPGWQRPASVLACGLCAREFYRAAGPLEEVTA